MLNVLHSSYVHKLNKVDSTSHVDGLAQCSYSQHKLCRLEYASNRNTHQHLRFTSYARHRVRDERALSKKHTQTRAYSTLQHCGVHICHVWADKNPHTTHIHRTRSAQNPDSWHIDYTHMMSPSLRRVCIRAQLLWSLVVTARRRRGDILAGIAPSSSGSVSRLPPMRTIGDEPRRRVDICRPAAPPSILSQPRMDEGNWIRTAVGSIEREKEMGCGRLYRLHDCGWPPICKVFFFIILLCYAAECIPSGCINIIARA